MIEFFINEVRAATPSSIDTPEDIVKLVGDLSGWMWRIFLIVAVIMILYSAYLFLFAGGNSETLDKAKKQLKYAVIAIIVALLAGGAVKLIQSILG